MSRIGVLAGLRRHAAQMLVIVATVGAVPGAGAAQERPRLQTPWAIGEYLEYTVKFGVISAGSGRMQVVGHDTVRGRPTWRFRFDFSGGLPWLGLRINDSYDSWVDTVTQNSLRFEQRLSDFGKNRHRIYEIFPERAKFRLNGGDEQPSVSNPLDDASLMFAIRTIPLEVGKSYDLNRYFDHKANPVTIIVLRRDTVDVPAGRFPAIVIQPLIKTTAMFSEGGHAEIWLSDDERRILLQMKTKLPFGSLNLYLRKFTLPPLSPGDSSRSKRP